MTLTQIVRPKELGVRARRVELEGGLVVESKTLGTSLAYSMATENISRTGLLLNCGRNHRIPFIVNTLIEMTVDPDAAIFERPVSCLGKVVRLVENDEGGKPRFGVHIVQIDSRDVDMWDRCVSLLENGRTAQGQELPAAG